MMTKRELFNLCARLTARCWVCGVDLPPRRRKGKFLCGPTCRKRLQRQWDHFAAERLKARYPRSEISFLPTKGTLDESR